MYYTRLWELQKIRLFLILHVISDKCTGRIKEISINFIVSICMIINDGVIAADSTYRISFSRFTQDYFNEEMNHINFIYWRIFKSI